MARRLLYAVAIAALLIGPAPIAGILWSTGFAESHGCRVDEAGSYPCIVNGHDYGPALSNAFIAGWLFFLTAPIGLAGLILLAVLLISGWIARRRARTERNAP